MIEVFREGARWAWALICPAGRRLVWSEANFDTDHAAAGAAREYRAGFFSCAIAVDGCGVREA